MAADLRLSDRFRNIRRREMVVVIYYLKRDTEPRVPIGRLGIDECDAPFAVAFGGDCNSVEEGVCNDECGRVIPR